MLDRNNPWIARIKQTKQSEMDTFIRELLDAAEQGDPDANVLARRILNGQSIDPADLEYEFEDDPEDEEWADNLPESDNEDTPKTLQKFTNEELVSFIDQFPDLSERLDGSKELDDTHAKLDQIFSKGADGLTFDVISLYPEKFSEDTKNFTWQNNHTRIRSAMHSLMMQDGGMPSTQDIASETGLSRMTVNKHLTEMKVHPMFTEELKKFEMMQFSILTALCKEALRGNVKAAQLYFETMGNSGASIKNQTNNHLTINNLTITREDVEGLPAEKQQQFISLFQKDELPSKKRYGKS